VREAANAVTVGGMTAERAAEVAAKVGPYLKAAGPLLGLAHVAYAGVSEGPSKAGEAAASLAAGSLAASAVAFGALKVVEVKGPASNCFPET
jgi:hypothetical protein